MIEELLTRSLVFFRLGQAAAASLSFEAYLRHPEHVTGKLDHVVIAAIHAGDWLFAADAIEVGILAPLKAGRDDAAGAPAVGG